MKDITYEDVLRMLEEAESEQFVRHIEILLWVVWDMQKQHRLDISAFQFAISDEGFVTVRDVKGPE